jgi:hypothetical protein
MTFPMTNMLATLAAAAIFAVIFYYQSWWRWPTEGQRGHRRLISFSAGMAVAYVFVHLLPELATASEEFVEATEGRGLAFAHHRVHLAALLGFILFYGLQHMVSWSPQGQGQGNQHAAHGIRYRILGGSYALYVFIVSYLMAHNMEAGEGRLALFALAMGLHFLGLAHGLRHESHALYESWGKHVLAGAAIIGWAVAFLAPLPESTTHTLLGFVAGSVIMNTATSELPKEKEGRFLAFLIGGLVYAGFLVLISH